MPDETSLARPSPPPAAEALAGKTVLQIIPALEAGGAERTTVDVAEALADLGARALVATEGGRMIGELQARGGIWIPFAASTKNPWRVWRNVSALAHVIAEEAVDIVHARSRAPAWSAFYAARRAKVPFVTTYHGIYAAGSELKRRYNAIMARGEVVIANSAYTAELIRAVYPASAERVTIIHRGTDLSAFAPNSVAFDRIEKLRRDWGVSPDQRVVLLPGRLTGWKGQRVLIEAAALLRDRGIDNLIHVLAGDHQGRDGYVATLDAMIAERDLAGTVRRVGHCFDMPAAYLAASVAVVPSTEPEAFGRTAVEAQAMGCPVIVSDHGATPETVLAPPETPDLVRTGWRVPPGDAAALADAIADALRLGASARDALALRARAHVEANFSLTAMCRATLAVYAGLVAKAESPPRSPTS